MTEPHEGARKDKLAFAKRMRDNPTHYEKWFWKKLRKNVKGSQVWRQTVLWGYIVDFYIPEVKLAVELDGRGHDPAKDALRDARLSHKGVTVMRFPNPKTQVEINGIYAKVYCEVLYRQNNPGAVISTFPPDLSKHQESSELLRESKSEEDERSGNVEENQIINKLNQLGDYGCAILVRNRRKSGKACTKQIFSSVEVAENMVRVLAKMDIVATVEPCADCKQIHLREILPCSETKAAPSAASTRAAPRGAHAASRPSTAPAKSAK